MSWVGTGAAECTGAWLWIALWGMHGSPPPVLCLILRCLSYGGTQLPLTQRTPSWMPRLEICTSLVRWLVWRAGYLFVAGLDAWPS